MTSDLYSRVLAALTYAVNSTAHRRDPKNTGPFLATRDEFAALYSDFQPVSAPSEKRKCVKGGV